jgi:anti-sigma B factor antagonist
MNNDVVQGFDNEKDEHLKLTLQKIQEPDGGLVVHASGYVDTYNADFFQEQIEKLVEAGFPRIAIEMGAISYVSSAGMAAFTFLLRMTRGRNGDLVLNRIQPRVHEVFQLLGFSQFFTFTGNLDESVARLSESATTRAFPTVFRCPVCGTRRKASKAGRFRCGECKTILVIDRATTVVLG